MSHLALECVFLSCNVFVNEFRSDGCKSQGRRSLWDRGTCPPNIYEGTSIIMSHPKYTVVCCILMQILSVVSQKKLQLLEDFVPRLPTGAPPWTLLGDFCPPDPQSSFMPPSNNPVRSTPLVEVETNNKLIYCIDGAACRMRLLLEVIFNLSSYCPQFYIAFILHRQQGRSQEFHWGYKF